MGREARARAKRFDELSKTAAGCLQIAGEFAEASFARAGGSEPIDPMFIAVLADGEAMIIAPPWNGREQKAMVLEGLRAVFKQKRVLRYAVATEAWMGPAGGLLPRDRPDRREGIMLLAVDKSGDRLAGYREIDRPWDGSNPTLGPLEETSAPSGPMASLLDD